MQGDRRRGGGLLRRRHRPSALAEKTGVEMPITEAAYQVLYDGKDPKVVIIELMTRAKKHELEDSWV